MSRIEQLLELNEEQKRILSQNSRIAVEAGAGSGKTRSLVAKYLHILENNEATVEQIVAITFTNNAARELRKKIGENIVTYIDRYGERNHISRSSLRRLSSAPIGTIHGFCSRLIRENAYDSMISPDFSILEDHEREKFYEKNLRDFVVGCIKKGDKDILQLLEYEGYDYPEIISIVNYILQKSSLLHLEPPFPVYKAATDHTYPGSPGFEIPDVLLENYFTNLTARSQKKIERIKSYVSGIDASTGIRGTLQLILNIHKEVEKELKSEKAEEARKELFLFLDNIINRFNHRLTSLYVNLANGAYRYLQDRKRENHVLDFEDQIRFSYNLLNGNEELLEQYRKRFRYLIVDEFQDTDGLQFKLLSLLTEGPDNKLVVVGDKKQSIYSFRGGEPAIMEEVLSDDSYYSYSLRNNYRSSDFLIRYFNSFFSSVFAGHYEQMCFSGGCGSSGQDTEVIFTADGDDSSRNREIKAVCSRVVDLVNSGVYRDVALLFRNSTHASGYERELQQRHVVYNSDFGYGYYRNHEIRDLICILKYLFNPGDRVSRTALLRSPFLGASDSSLLKYENGAADKTDEDTTRIYKFLEFLDKKRDEIMNLDALSVISHIMHDMGYCASLLALPRGREKLLNVWKFYNICERLVGKGYGTVDIIEYFDEMRDSGNESQPFIEQAQGTTVKLTTVHRSKGLEYDVVILCDTNYPMAKNRSRVAGDGESGFFIRFGNSKCVSWQELEEIRKRKIAEDEKRLLYVAKTRAKKKLILALRESRGSGKVYNEGSFAVLIGEQLGILDDKSDDVLYKGFSLPRYHCKSEAATVLTGTHQTDKGFKAVKGFTDKLYVKSRQDNPETTLTHVFSNKGVDIHNPVAVGDIMHRFMEVWDFNHRTVQRSAEFVLNEYYYTDHSFAIQLSELAERFSKSYVHSLINSSIRYYREYGFTAEMDGKVERGRIDLLVETQAGPVLVDYKYTQTSDVEKFRQQIELYSRAVEMKYGCPPSERYIVLLPEFKVIPV